MKKENKKIIYKFLKFTIIFTFIIFLTLYFSFVSGYYEYSNHEKMVFTEKQIKQFEQDVQNGKNINIEKYMENTNKDYQNGISALGLNISSLISSGVNKGVEKFFDFLINFIDE